MEINNNNQHIDAFHVTSPLVESDELSKLLQTGENDAKVFLKLDNIQPSGSFKIRGIGHLISEVICPCKILIKLTHELNLIDCKEWLYSID